jgi:predicted nucleotidyltransferase component of viral defense system
MINYSFVDEKARTSKIDSFTILREYWQLLFLQRLYEFKDSRTFFFKGGTAIRFLLNSFRFSEDLDFTVSGSKEDAEKLLMATFLKLQQQSRDVIEFKKERVWDKFKEVSLRYKLMFLPKDSKQLMSIKIDVSLREKPLTKSETVLTPFDYPISPYPLVVHLSFAEILSEKIRAMLVRQTPRDLFDLWFLLTKKVPFDQKYIKKKLTLYPEIKFDLTILEEKISSYDEKEIKTDLNQFLPRQYRSFFNDLKNKTLDELKLNIYG